MEVKFLLDDGDSENFSDGFFFCSVDLGNRSYYYGYWGYVLDSVYELIDNYNSLILFFNYYGS